MTVMTYGDNIGSSMLKTLEHDPVFRSIAYFSMEIAIRPEIPTYSGGLGVLAGDILKSAADLGVPMAGITLLYRKGYFIQHIDEGGNQQEQPVEWKPEEFLTLLPNEVTVSLEGRPVKVRTWVYDQVGQSGYPLPIYFLDTDFEGNSPADRNLTWHLYGGDQRYRLCQELILGVGGLRMLRDLGYRNIKTFHLNEGHAGFLTLELMREQGYESYEKIRDKVIFTTHTPVPAGHDHFSYELIDRVMDPIFVHHIKRMMGPEGVSMTELGLKYSRYVNGVSVKHAEVSRNMFGNAHVDAVTNGVHSTTWTCPGFAKLFDRDIPGWRNDPSRLIQALQLSDEEVWKAHQAAKMKLLARVLEETGQELDADVFTIGFARRAAAYKRADLIFSDVKKLLDVCSGQVQFIFAGKAHPNDEPGKALIRRIHSMAKEIGTALPIVFMENYDMSLGAVLTAGVDLWLNNPRRPREASGTSGMKCTHNGVMNFSVLDGWWIEGWVEDVTGWSIGPEPSEAELVDYDEMQDALDLYAKLEDKILPTYYHQRDKWVSMMKHTIALNASFFNTHRVVKEYCEKAYGTVFRGL
ncbi:alpha-glucan phosphorylase [Aminomonas paucivorans DSM 12260]|uniref:Alpha-glucan phosphorylase n=1 Tax=Aminomonas paucivorans DSM 12260 TaxID=584708 RepID=E3CVL0_9BACT|nr:alpha-glucan family phosphorylase [Aminomonas paucivorans]EFQ24201.1 alpha-glucan phosphorylase [Aminomonas paucivorans DSM 12260]